MADPRWSELPGDLVNQVKSLYAKGKTALQGAVEEAKTFTGYAKRGEGKQYFKGKGLGKPLIKADIIGAQMRKMTQQKKRKRL